MPLSSARPASAPGFDKDRPDFGIELWRVNSPFSLLAGRTRVRK